MKTVMKKLKKHWTLVWLITVVIATTAFVVFGAYTGLKSVKRVVTTQSSPGELFSSNCMRTTLSTKRISTNVYSVTVCNYEQRNPLVPNPSDISYVLSAEIRVLYNNEYKTMGELATLLGEQSEAYQAYVTKIGSRTYSVAKTDDDEDGSLTPQEIVLNSENGYTYTFSSQRLKAKEQSSTDKYRVTFDVSELEDINPDFYVYLKAVSTGYIPIECLICAAQSTDDVAAWQGAFIEDLTYDYDFYNYIISGSGIGTVDILWDGDWFDINPFFTNSMSGNIVTGASIIDETGSPYNGWKKITLTVNSTQQNRYELQLYKMKTDTSYTGTNEPTNFITCKFTPSDD